MESSISRIDQLNNSAYQLKFTDIKKAVELAKEAQDLLSQFATPYQKGWVSSNIILGWEIYFDTDFIGSISIAESALTWFQNVDDQLGEMWALYLLGVSNTRIGNFAVAVECHLKQLDIARQVGDIQSIAEAHNVIGQVCNHLKEFEQSEKNLKQAYNLFESINDFMGQMLASSNLIYQAMLSNDHAKAIKIGEQALLLHQQAGSPPNRFICNLLHYTGRAHGALGNFDKAKDYFQEALRESEYGNFLIDKILARVSLGECYMWQADYERALETLHEALSLMNGVPITYAFTKCHRLLSEIYEIQGEMSLAYKYLKSYQQTQEQVLLEDGQMRLRYHALISDIEQVKFRNNILQQQREKDRRYFDSLTELRNDVVNTAKHDLSNPLTVIILNIHKLRKYGINNAEVFETSLDRLESSAQTMRELISDLLDIAKLETGRALKIESIPLERFIEHAIGFLVSLAEAKTIRLHSQVTTNIKLAKFDRLRIRQVLDNLISNSIKYTPEGGEVLLQVADDGKFLIFSIKDTGLGIPEKHLPKLFDRFYRVEEETHLAVQGTGLGLAIVKTIVDQHQGKITVKSELGIGSDFSFRIPLDLSSIEARQSQN